MRKWLPLGLVLFMALTLWNGCADKKGNAVGVDFLQRDAFGEEKMAFFYPANTDTFLTDPLTPGESQYLILGEAAGRSYQTFFSINPGSLPAGNTVDSAWVCLFIYSLEGDTTQLALPAVHAVNAAWQEDELSWETAQGLQGQQLDVTARVVSEDTLSFNLPLDFIQPWLDDTTNAETGFALTYSQGPLNDLLIKMASTQNTSITTYSYLKIFSHQDTTSEEHTLRFKQDTFISQYNILPDADRLWVHSGIGARSYLHFDVSSIPEPATINRALLTLQQDTLLAWPEAHDVYTVKSVYLTSEYIAGQSPELYDSYSALSSMETDSLVMNVTSLIQDWTSNTVENYGMMLIGNGEATDWNCRVFYSTHADSALIPVLRIYYSIPPMTLDSESSQSR